MRRIRNNLLMLVSTILITSLFTFSANADDSDDLEITTADNSVVETSQSATIIEEEESDADFSTNTEESEVIPVDEEEEIIEE